MARPIRTLEADEEQRRQLEAIITQATRRPEVVERERNSPPTYAYDHMD